MTGQDLNTCAPNRREMHTSWLRANASSWKGHVRLSQLGSKDMSLPSATLKQPRDPGACQGGGSPLKAPILAFPFSTQMKGIKLGPIMDLQIKIVPKGPSTARMGSYAECPQMLLFLNFPSNQELLVSGFPGMRNVHGPGLLDL